MNAAQPTTEIQAAFKDLAFQLGGIIHLHAVNDDAAWALARIVDTAYRRTLQAVTDPAQKAAPAAGLPKPHPSVRQLIQSIATH